MQPPSDAPLQGHLEAGYYDWVPSKRNGAAINCLAFSADGSRLVSGGADGAVLVWDLSGAGFSAPRRLTGPSRYVNGCAILGGDRVVSVGGDREVFTWSLLGGSEGTTWERKPSEPFHPRSIGLVRGHGEAVDTTRFVVGSNRGKVFEIELDKDARPVLEASHDAGKGAMVFSVGRLADGKLFSADDSGLRINGKDHISGPVVAAPLWGTRLLVGRSPEGESNELAIHDVAAGSTKSVSKAPSTPIAIAVSSKRELVAVSYLDGGVKIFKHHAGAGLDDTTLEEVCPYSSEVASEALAFRPDGAQLAIGSDDGRIDVIDAATCKSIRSVAPELGEITAVAASGHHIILGDGTGRVSTFTWNNWQRKWSWRLHKGGVTALATLPTEQEIVISGGLDRRILTFQETGGKPELYELTTLPHWTHTIVPTVGMAVRVGLAMDSKETRDGVGLVPLSSRGAPPNQSDTISSDGFVRAIAVRPSKQEVLTYGGFDSNRFWYSVDGVKKHWSWKTGLADMAYDAEGEHLFAAHEDGSITVWGHIDSISESMDVQALTNNRMAAELAPPGSGYVKIALTANDLWAASGDEVHGWPLAGVTQFLAGGKRPEFISLTSPEAAIRDIATTPNGEYLIAGLADGRAAVYELSSKTLIRYLVVSSDGSWAAPRMEVVPSGDGGALKRTLSLDADQSGGRIKALSLTSTPFSYMSRPPATAPPTGVLAERTTTPSVTLRSDGTSIVRMRISSPKGEPRVRLDDIWDVQFGIRRIEIEGKPTDYYDVELHIRDDRASGSTPGHYPSICPRPPQDAHGPLHFVHVTTHLGDEDCRWVIVERDVRLNGRAALIIGNGKYSGDKLEPLPGAMKDAKGMMAALASSTSWKIPSGGKTLKENLEGAAFRSELDQFFNDNAGKDLFFYYAGHGETRGGEGYLLAADHDKDAKNDVSAQLLWSYVKASTANRIVLVIDTCRSGSFILPEGIGAEAVRERVAIITATSDGKSAFELPSGGIFSAKVIEAINRGGPLTVYEAFLAGANAAAPQQPLISGSSAALDLPLVWAEEGRPMPIPLSPMQKGQTLPLSASLISMRAREGGAGSVDAITTDGCKLRFTDYQSNRKVHSLLITIGLKPGLNEKPVAQPCGVKATSECEHRINYVNNQTKPTFDVPLGKISAGEYVGEYWPCLMNAKGGKGTCENQIIKKFAFTIPKEARCN